MHGGETKTFADWSASLFATFREVAAILDKANASADYTQAVELEWQKVQNPDLTPSGRILAHLLAENTDNSTFGLALAKRYAEEAQHYDFRFYQHSDFTAMATSSLAAQEEIEAEEEKPFAEFIHDYFAEPMASKES